MAHVTQFKLRTPDDMHVHLRDGDLLKEVLPHTTNCFGRALVMPNTTDPTVTGTQAERYKNDILRLSEGTGFEPLMTIKLTHGTSPQTIKGAAAAGVLAVKLYPEGVTTNSENGVRDISKLDDTFKAMADAGLVLCVHAEEPRTFCMEREFHYLPHIARIASKHPALKIVIEHVTTAAALKFVREAGPNVAATITVHHLFLTLDDVVGDKLNPHNFCKPIAKFPHDRDALVAAVLSGDSQFFLGTDSAPHRKGAKECSSGCAGCFTAPIAIPLLAGLFEREDGMLDELEAFTSMNGARFYGLKPSEHCINLERSEWTIPETYGVDPIVPFKAGELLNWKISGR